MPPGPNIPEGGPPVMPPGPNMPGGPPAAMLPPAELPPPGRLLTITTLEAGVSTSWVFTGVTLSLGLGAGFVAKITPIPIAAIRTATMMPIMSFWFFTVGAPLLYYDASEALQRFAPL